MCGEKRGGGGEREKRSESESVQGNESRRSKNAVPPGVTREMQRKRLEQCVQFEW